MAKVTLDYSGLKGQATVIKRQKEDFDALIKKVMSTMDALNQVWDDAAAKDFTDRVKNMQPIFNKFGDALLGLSAHMDQVSAKYLELSQTVKSSQSGF